MKKNFIIYASAINAKTGGAHSILENFLASLDQDLVPGATWQFIGNLDYENLCLRNNIQFHRLNLNKKWLLRILYDFLLFKILFLRNKPPTHVISFQNTTPKIRLCDTSLTYIHQAIPFIENFYPHPISNLKLFLIKHFYFFFISFGLSKSRSFFIIQSEWLKKICAEKLKTPESHFIIHRPLPTDIVLSEFTKQNITPDIFFYPSLYQDYKNHDRLILAFIQAAEKNPNRNFELGLTIERNDVLPPKNLQINFYGVLSRLATLEKINAATAVIFPSLIESYGMPIAEAIFLKTPVLGSDLPYARELLGESGNYFDPMNITSMQDAIVNFSADKYVGVEITKNKFQDWGMVLENFLNKTSK